MRGLFPQQGEKKKEIKHTHGLRGADNLVEWAGWRWAFHGAMPHEKIKEGSDNEWLASIVKGNQVVERNM